MLRSAAPLKPGLFSLSHTPSRPSWWSWFHLFLSHSGCIYFLKWSSIDSLSWTGLTSQPVWAQVQIHTLKDSNSYKWVMCVNRCTLGELQKGQISNQNSNCIRFSSSYWTRLIWLAAACRRAFMSWMSNLPGHIFFSPAHTLISSFYTHPTPTLQSQVMTFAFSI